VLFSPLTLPIYTEELKRPHMETLSFISDNKNVTTTARPIPGSWISEV